MHVDRVSKVRSEHLRLEAYVVAGLQGKFDTLVVLLVPKDPRLVNNDAGILLSNSVMRSLELVCLPLRGHRVVASLRLNCPDLLVELCHLNTI